MVEALGNDHPGVPIFLRDEDTAEVSVAQQAQQAERRQLQGLVRENATLITYNDITPLLPAVAIAGLTVAVNFVVDWMLHLSSGLKTEHQ